MIRFVRLLATLAFLIFTASNVTAQQCNFSAYIPIESVGSVELKLSPVDSSRFLNSIPTGQYVTVHTTIGSWAQIETDNKEIGWVPLKSFGSETLDKICNNGSTIDSNQVINDQKIKNYSTAASNAKEIYLNKFGNPFNSHSPAFVSGAGNSSPNSWTRFEYQGLEYFYVPLSVVNR